MQVQALAQRRHTLMPQVNAATPSAPRSSSASYACRGCCSGDGWAILLTTAASRGCVGAVPACGRAAALSALPDAGSACRCATSRFSASAGGTGSLETVFKCERKVKRQAKLEQFEESLSGLQPLLTVLRARRFVLTCER